MPPRRAKLLRVLLLFMVFAGAMYPLVASAASCKTQSQMTAAQRDALSSAARTLVGEVQSGNAQALRANTIPAVAADFGGIAGSVDSLKPLLQQATITKALSFLEDICAAFERKGFDVAVIKSLDHWPDLGSDLDLYTDASPEDVTKLMKWRFDAQIAPRSWGDRLAGKWNFLIAGLPEAVEIHMGRLGQTGEQVGIASCLVERSRRVVIGKQAFRVPSASDRLMVSTLQRMYRHFYFRLCDIVDTVALAAGGIDYQDLRSSATLAGIWEGVATYLMIVSDYAQRYSGSGVELPQFVLDAARFGGNEVYYAKDFLRVPILPQSARLYGEQLAGLLRRRELQNGARLSLLPWLATAALVGQRITGSDKGIW